MSSQKIIFYEPTSVAFPWLRACSVKLQLLWMCSFPWRREESWAWRTCIQKSGKWVDKTREPEHKKSNNCMCESVWNGPFAWSCRCSPSLWWGLSCGDAEPAPALQTYCWSLLLPQFFFHLAAARSHSPAQQLLSVEGVFKTTKAKFFIKIFSADLKNIFVKL